jgi:hypothetical protein
MIRMVMKCISDVIGLLNRQCVCACNLRLLPVYYSIVTHCPIIILSFHCECSLSKLTKSAIRFFFWFSILFDGRVSFQRLFLERVKRELIVTRSREECLSPIFTAVCRLLCHRITNGVYIS